MTGASVPTPVPADRAVCSLRNVSRSFGPVKALSDVSFDIRQGEFLALIGENGAGKSTAMGVLFGLVDPDTGHVEVDGTPRRFASARDAIDAGFGMVHQHFKLYPELTVIENVLVGNEGGGPLARIPFRAAEARLRDIIETYDFRLDLQATVADLSVGEKQRVEILKLLFRDAQVIFLDEPTAVLTPQECLSLFDMLRRLQKEGASIVLISHKLDEVIANAERILVMRRGALVAERAAEATDRAELAGLMVGAQIETPAKVNAATERTVLSIRDLTVAGPSGKPRVDAASFDVAEGEIFGIAGVSGNGQKALVDALMGLETPTGGTVLFKGEEITAKSVAERRAAGIGYMSEDRMSVGLAAQGSITENAAAGREHTAAFSRRGWLRKRAMTRHAETLIEAFDIRTPSAQQHVGKLSGGNQQKVVVAREVSAQPRLLLVENPCWGVDVGAMATIHGQLLELAKSGCAIVLVSSDLEELFALSDRVGVIYEGAIGRIFPRDALDTFAIGAAMAGGGHIGDKHA